MTLLVGVSFGADVLLAAGSGLYTGWIELANGLPVLVEVEVEEDFEVRVEHHRNGAARLFGLPLPMRSTDIGQAGS